MVKKYNPSTRPRQLFDKRTLLHIIVLGDNMRKRTKYTIEDYDVTENGEVINLHNKHKRVLQPNTKGYLRVTINGKNLLVHRLVAKKYVPNPENKPQVNHIDGNKLNNHYTNLEWVTNQENRTHAVEHGLQLTGEKCSWSKLNNDKVKFIRKHKKDISIREFTKLFNVTRSAIKSVLNNKTWKKSNN